VNLRPLIISILVLSFYVAVLSVPSQASSSPADSVSLTITSTTSLSATSGGTIQVSFNSVDLTYASPQAYSFGVTATASPGKTITHLSWQFGDGASKDVTYCCQNQVSEVQSHAYSQPGTYTVSVIAYDNDGSFGFAQVTVNWITPIPEYPSYGIALLISLLLVPVFLKSKRLISPH